MGAATAEIIKLDIRGASSIMMCIAYWVKGCRGKPVLSNGLLGATMHLLEGDGLTIHTETMWNFI